MPLVYLNLEPVNVAELPDNEAYVGSKETESGKLGATEACKLLKAQGKGDGARAYILMGDLAHNAAVMRTQSVRDVAEHGSSASSSRSSTSRRPAGRAMARWT